MLVSSKRLDSVLIWFSVGHYLFGLDVVVSTLFCNQFCFCLLMLLWRAAYITARANLSEHKSDQVGHSTFKTFQLSSPCAWEFRKKNYLGQWVPLFSVLVSLSSLVSYISSFGHVLAVLLFPSLLSQGSSAYIKLQDHVLLLCSICHSCCLTVGSISDIWSTYWLTHC